MQRAKKDIRRRFIRRIWRGKLYKPSDRFVPPQAGEILMAIICIMMGTMILTWSSSIEPPGLPQQTYVNLNRLDRYHVICTIHTISPPAARIDFLTYTNATGGTFILNQMGNSGEPVNDVGEFGIIYLSGYNEHLTVVAVFSDTEDGSGKREYKNQIVFDGVI